MSGPDVSKLSTGMTGLDILVFSSGPAHLNGH
jgi:hypothetical protein